MFFDCTKLFFGGLSSTVSLHPGGCLSRYAVQNVLNMNTISFVSSSQGVLKKNESIITESFRGFFFFLDPLLVSLESLLRAHPGKKDTIFYSNCVRFLFFFFFIFYLTESQNCAL